jgi:dTDP-4-dehydrorhamnose reductase
MKNVILGDGLLGTELRKQTGWEYFSRKKDNFDISDKNIVKTPLFGYGETTLINCIAYTDTYSNDKTTHWDVNVMGIKNLIDYCNKWDCKLVHISTDYIYTNSVHNASEEDVPVHCNNWYGYTKLVSDALVQMYPKHLVIRGTHKPYPFPFEKAWTDQVGNFDYVNKITSLIIKLIEKECTGIYNVGTEIKSMYDLATKTKNVQPANKPLYCPSDTTMDLCKLNNVLK